MNNINRRWPQMGRRSGIADRLDCPYPTGISHLR